MTQQSTPRRGILRHIGIPGIFNFVALLALFVMMVVLQQLFGRFSGAPTASAPATPEAVEEERRAMTIVAGPGNAIAIPPRGLAAALLPSMAENAPATTPKMLPTPPPQAAHVTDTPPLAKAPTPETPRVDVQRTKQKRRAIQQRQRRLAAQRQALNREREVSVEELDTEAARLHYRSENARLSRGGAHPDTVPATASVGTQTFIPFEHR